jgi:hypothetical protein
VAGKTPREEVLLFSLIQALNAEERRRDDPGFAQGFLIGAVTGMCIQTGFSREVFLERIAQTWDLAVTSRAHWDPGYRPPIPGKEISPTRTVECLDCGCEILVHSRAEPLLCDTCYAHAHGFCGGDCPVLCPTCRAHHLRKPCP